MSPEVEAAIIAGGVGVLTVIAALYGTRKTSRDTKDGLNTQLTEQREALDRTLKEQRDQLDKSLTEQRTRTLNERFATAAGQLGSDKPPAVRLAGVYAMAGLADDWKKNRPTCTEVLCAYLRLPYEPHLAEALTPSDPKETEAAAAKLLDYQASREVRHTIIRVITAHLRPRPVKSWQRLNFDFTGAAFDGGEFRNAVFMGGQVSFAGARFTGGEVSFAGARFTGGEVIFRGAAFTGGEVSFRGAEFAGSHVSFVETEFGGGHVDFTGAQFIRSQVSFIRAKFASGQVNFDLTGLTGGELIFRGAAFTGGRTSFRGATFTGSEVRFTGAEFTGGEVSFAGAEFADGQVRFGQAAFTGSLVSFDGAKFSGGEVDFHLAAKWRNPPSGLGPPPPHGVRLPDSNSLPT